MSHVYPDDREASHVYPYDKEASHVYPDDREALHVYSDVGKHHKSIRMTESVTCLSG